MEPTIHCGKPLAEHVDIRGSRFHDVDLADGEFDDVCMTRVRINNVNMSDMTIEYVQIGGMTIRHVGLPPDARVNERQRPVLFEECDLNGSAVRQCDLSNVRIENCDLNGATVDGILVSDLVAAWKKVQGQKQVLPD